MNLNQVTVSVKNIEKSIAFYETLGLILIVKSPHYARFECPEGDATFSISLQENEYENYGTTIYFELDNLDKKVEELLKKGVHFIQLPMDKSYLWREANLKDLDNNIIKLFYAGDNRKNPPWRVKNNAIKKE
ncbi:MAG: VOC family protein [Ferruginibacter sp.]|nr:VOC family protein [Ferruginibacter sp.]